MTMANTPKQGYPYPLANEKVGDVNDHIRNLALMLDGKNVLIFADQAEMTSKYPSATEGAIVYLKDSNVLQLRLDSSWVTLYPASPAIYSGSSAPSSSLGVTGDIYVQY